MKILRSPILIGVVAACLIGTTPAWAVNRDIVELQTQVQNLQTQLTQMQQSLDERMGVLRHLMDQNTDSMNKVTSAVTNMQTTLQKQQSDTNNHVDQLSGQLQSQRQPG